MTGLIRFCYLSIIFTQRKTTSWWGCTNAWTNWMPIRRRCRLPGFSTVSVSTLPCKRSRSATSVEAGECECRLPGETNCCEQHITYFDQNMIRVYLNYFKSMFENKLHLFVFWLSTTSIIKHFCRLFCRNFTNLCNFTELCSWNLICSFLMNRQTTSILMLVCGSRKNWKSNNFVQINCLSFSFVLLTVCFVYFLCCWI